MLARCALLDGSNAAFSEEDEAEEEEEAIANGWEDEEKREWTGLGEVDKREEREEGAGASKVADDVEGPLAACLLVVAAMVVSRLGWDGNDVEKL